MSKDKIMPRRVLDNMVDRLNACLAIIRLVHGDMAVEVSGSDLFLDALHGAIDALRATIRDYQAAIDAADDYEGGKG